MSNKVIAVKIGADIGELRKSMGIVQSTVASTMGTVKNSFSGFSKSGSESANQVKDSFINSFAKIAVGAQALKGAFNFGTSLVESASEAQASGAQFEQVFSGMQEEARSALNGVSKETSMLPGRLQDSFVKISAFAKTTGMDTSDALELGERALLASADSAAFYDKTVEEATDSLQSFLKGNYANDAALGISATETTRNAKANELYSKSFNDLDEAQKQLTLLQMVEDGNKLSGALGQASRESDEYVNILGNMKRLFEELKIAVGTPFLDIVTKSMMGFNDVLQSAIPYVERFASSLAEGNWADIGSMFGELSKGAGELLEQFPVLGAIIAGVGALIFQSFAVAPLSIFGGGMSHMIGTLFPLFSSGMGTIASSVGATFTSITGNLGGVAGAVANLFGSVGSITTSAVGSISSAIVSVVGVALKMLAPAVLLATVLVGMGAIYQTFGEQIDAMAELAITKAPTIIESLLSGFASKIPELIASGAQLFVLLVEIINANLPVIATGGMEIVTSLISGLVTQLPMLIESAISLITTITTTLIQMLPQLILAGMDILMGLISGIVDNLPMLMSSVSTIIDTLTSTLATYLPMIITSGIDILLALIDGVVKMIPKLIPMAVDLISTIFDTLVSNLPTIISGGIEIVNSLAQGVLDNLPAIVDGAVSLITSMASTIADNLPTILQKGIELVVALASGLIEALPEIISAGGDIISGLWETVLEADWLSLGSDMVAGIAKGISGAIGSVMEAMGGVVTGALDWAKEKLGIHSPSRVMRDVIGKMIPQGIAVGVEKDSDIAIDSVGDLSEDLAVSAEYDVNRWNLGAKKKPLNIQRDEERSASRSVTEAVYQFEIPVIVDGREIAKATAEFTQNELDKMKVRKNRLSGVRV